MPLQHAVLFTPGLGIPAFHIKAFWTCVTVLSTATLNRPSLSPDWIQSECFHLHMSTRALQPETFPLDRLLFGLNWQSSSFVLPTKNGMLSNWMVFLHLLSSVILNFWSSDTPYLLRIYYTLVFADYWPQMFVAVVFSACELLSFSWCISTEVLQLCGICVLESLYECMQRCRCCSHSQKLGSADTFFVIMITSPRTPLHRMHTTEKNAEKQLEHNCTVLARVEFVPYRTGSHMTHWGVTA